MVLSKLKNQLSNGQDPSLLQNLTMSATHTPIVAEKLHSINSSQIVAFELLIQQGKSSSERFAKKMNIVFSQPLDTSKFVLIMLLMSTNEIAISDLSRNRNLGTKSRLNRKWNGLLLSNFHDSKTATSPVRACKNSNSCYYRIKRETIIDET
jgi:hypothetical protein